jgi:hypothetical protein
MSGAVGILSDMLEVQYFGHYRHRKLRLMMSSPVQATGFDSIDRPALVPYEYPKRLIKVPFARLRHQGSNKSRRLLLPLDAYQSQYSGFRRALGIHQAQPQFSDPYNPHPTRVSRYVSAKNLI